MVIRPRYHQEGGEIKIVQPEYFDFDQCLKFLNRSPKECLHRVTSSSWIKLLSIDDRPVIIEVSSSDKYLTIAALNVTLDHKLIEQVVPYIMDVFDLGRDLKPFYHKMADDLILGSLINKYSGLRLVGIPDLFEALSWSIIGQQINLAFAYELKKRLVMAKGSNYQFEGKEYYSFPSPESIANMSEEDFTPWQFSKSKSRYLIGVAQELSSGTLYKEDLTSMSSNEVLDRLTSMKGVGPWSANYVMMKCLKIDSAYPVADVGLHNAIKLQLGMSEKPTPSQLEEYRKQWHPWEAYSTFYLWHSLVK